MSKDPQAVALGKKRWAKKTRAEKRAHAMKMVEARKGKKKSTGNLENV